MRLGRSPVIIAAALASAGALAFTSVGPAAALDLVGTGTVTCSAGYVGSIQFLQPLTNVGVLTSEEVEVTVNFGGCTGGTPNPTAAHYVAKGVFQGAGANNCANWFAAPSTSPTYKTRIFTLKGSVAWTSSPAVTSSSVLFTGLRVKTGTAGRFTFLLPNTGSGTVGGSYAPTANTTFKIDSPQSYPAITASCSGPGVSALHVVSTGSSGTW